MSSHGEQRSGTHLHSLQGNRIQRLFRLASFYSGFDCRLSTSLSSTPLHHYRGGFFISGLLHLDSEKLAVANRARSATILRGVGLLTCQKMPGTSLNDSVIELCASRCEGMVHALVMGTILDYYV